MVAIDIKKELRKERHRRATQQFSDTSTSESSQSSEPSDDEQVAQIVRSASLQNFQNLEKYALGINEFAVRILCPSHTHRYCYQGGWIF